MEARGIAFFPDHEPNTCPSLEVAVPGGLDVKVINDNDHNYVCKYLLKRIPIM